MSRHNEIAPLTTAILLVACALTVGCGHHGPQTSGSIANCCSQLEKLPPEQGKECLEALKRYRDREMPRIEPIAEIINDAISEIEEREDGTVAFSVNLGKLRSHYPDTKYADGVLSFSHRGHRYRCYVLLLAAECIQANVKEQSVSIAISAPPSKRKRAYEAECGKYAWKMTKDDRACWIWDLLPGFNNEPSPSRGGPLTHDQLSHLKNETKRKLSCPE